MPPARVFDLLFVYGTLRGPCRNKHALLLSRNAARLGRARMRGRLYRLDRYPGMKLSREADEWVVGEVYRLRDPAGILAILDEYEGSEFDRVQGRAILKNARSVRCLVYVYNRAVSEKRRISSGDFLNESHG